MLRARERGAAERLGRRLWREPTRVSLRVALLLRLAAESAVRHDVFSVAQATAYSAMVSLFPALVVVAAGIALLPPEFPLRQPLAVFFGRMLPASVIPLVDVYFGRAHAVHTVRAIAGAGLVSVMGAASLIARLMSGFRRAFGLAGSREPASALWLRSLCLVPVLLVPMSAASVLVVFGRVLTGWVTRSLSPELRLGVNVVAFGLRWGVALAGSTAVLALIYHLGTDLRTVAEQQHERREPRGRHWLWLPEQQSWRASLPGAVVATLLWFVSTLGFGVYVTRFANYTQVYGSLGAAIALMVWLFLIALCVLVGAEYNAQSAALSHDLMAEGRLWKLLRSQEAVGQVE